MYPISDCDHNVLSLSRHNCQWLIWSGLRRAESGPNWGNYTEQLNFHFALCGADSTQLKWLFQPGEERDGLWWGCGWVEKGGEVKGSWTRVIKGPEDPGGKSGFQKHVFQRNGISSGCPQNLSQVSGFCPSKRLCFIEHLHGWEPVSLPGNEETRCIISPSVYYCWCRFNCLISVHLFTGGWSGWVSILSNKWLKNGNTDPWAGVCCRWCLFICVTEITGCFLSKWLIVLARKARKAPKSCWSLAPLSFLGQNDGDGRPTG